ncbi:carboxylesterase family protein [Streptomyces flaveolus]|uniref:carboxylesterase family protein n=1 Tax=Streptomyces flaveolus TaxID=67297 RepID=UPI0036FB5420
MPLATEYGAQCAQAGGYGTPSASTGSEDCLYLDVYTPTGAQARHQGLPVLF